MKTVEPEVVYVTAIVVLLSLALWLAALFAYVADDWVSPAADGRSVPAAKTY